MVINFYLVDDRADKYLSFQQLVALLSDELLRDGNMTEFAVPWRQMGTLDDALEALEDPNGLFLLDLVMPSYEDTAEDLAALLGWPDLLDQARKLREDAFVRDEKVGFALVLALAASRKGREYFWASNLTISGASWEALRRLKGCCGSVSLQDGEWGPEDLRGASVRQNVKRLADWARSRMEGSWLPLACGLAWAHSSQNRWHDMAEKGVPRQFPLWEAVGDKESFKSLYGRASGYPLSVDALRSHLGLAGIQLRLDPAAEIDRLFPPHSAGHEVPGAVFLVNLMRFLEELDGDVARSVALCATQKGGECEYTITIGLDGSGLRFRDAWWARTPGPDMRNGAAVAAFRQLLSNGDAFIRESEPSVRKWVAQRTAEEPRFDFYTPPMHRALKPVPMVAFRDVTCDPDTLFLTWVSSKPTREPLEPLREVR